MSAEDTLAVCMLTVLLIASAAIMTILFSMMKHAGQKDELAELMADEESAVEDDSQEQLIGPSEEADQPWEQDADWWKK